MAKILVVGTGYVGLTTGACFAHIGHVVTCLDVNRDKIEGLQNGRMPIVETGIEDLVREGRESGRLSFTDDYAEGGRGAEVVFLCVPTPEGEDGSADLSYVEAAARKLAPLVTSGTIVVNKSTVPVGSTRVVEREMKRSDVPVVSNPEFLREGSAIQDFLKPDRVVVGSDDQEAAVKVASLYESLGAPVVITDPASAETIKYAANAFLATKISFVNAVAAICEGVGADIKDVVLGLGYDKRIGHEFLRPGPGWGGSCFPKDTKALVKIAEQAGYSFDMLKGVITVNDQQYDRIAAKIVRTLPTSPRDAIVGVWGLTFKAQTDDLRDSPSIEICKRLLDIGVQLRAYDPTVTTAPPALDSEGFSVVGSAAEAAVGAHVLAVLTEWDEFRWVPPSEVAAVMETHAVVDARNILEKPEWTRAGFDYQGVGR